MDKFAARWRRLLAIMIIVVVAGPEVYLFTEGIVILEIIGAATFVFMYAVGAKLYCHNAWNWLYTFENRYHFFMPSAALIRAKPGFLYFALPTRSITYGLFLFLMPVFLFRFYSILI
jgi:hypothetical protein